MNKELDIRVFNHHLIDNPSRDLSVLVTKTRNAQMYTFFEIFKGMMDTFPSPEECQHMLESNPKHFFNKYVEPLCVKVNAAKNAHRNTEVYDDEFFENMNKAGLNPELMDILDTSPEKMANPTLADIMPDIVISKSVFMETAETGNIQYPYGTIPMMCMIPSTLSIYDKHDDMSKLYYKVEREDKSRFESPTLEVSLKSLLADYASIYSEYDVETKILNSAGLEEMRTVVEKYADFVMPLIFITLRKDYEFTENYISDIYNFFTQNYQSALVANKFMFAITNALVYSRLGYALIHAYAFTHATSTIDLINPNDPYRQLLLETMPTVTGTSDMSTYWDQICAQMVDFTKLVEDGLKERDAFTELMNRTFNLILSALSESVSLDGNIQMNTKIHDILKTSFNPLASLLAEIDVGTSALWKIMKNIGEMIRSGALNELAETVAEVQMVRTRTTSPGIRSNRAQFSPVAQQILTGKDIHTYSFIGNNAFAMECSSMMKEVQRTKVSPSAMRMLSVECENLSSMRDAHHVMMEAEMFKEALKMSTSDKRDDDTIQFENFLDNVINEVSKWKDSAMREL